MTETTFVVPEMWCPIPVERHPESGSFSSQARAWVERWGLHAGAGHQGLLLGSEIERLVELTVPRGQAERMPTLINLNYWYHAFDDAYGDAHAESFDLDRTAELAQRLHHVVEAPEAEADTADPFVGALREVACEMAAMASPEQYWLWKSSFQSYTSFDVFEAIGREYEQSPSIARYLRHCIDGRAARASMYAAAIAGGYVVAPAEMASGSFRALTETASLLACLANDIYSWGKERAQADHGYTLIRVLCNAYQCEEARALAHALALHDRIMARFLQLSAQVRDHPGTTAQGRRYVEDLKSWVAGQIAWGLGSMRFAHPDYRVEMPQAMAGVPVAMEAEAPPFAPIAWWWEVQPGSGGQ